MVDAIKNEWVVILMVDDDGGNGFMEKYGELRSIIDSFGGMAVAVDR